MEWLATDLSLFGVAMIFMGQMGGHFLAAKPKKVKDPKKLITRDLDEM